MNLTLRGFIKKEFTQAFRDPRMRVLIFILPIIQLTVFGFAISTEIKNIRLGFSFASNDIVAKHIYERAIASKWFLSSGSNVTIGRRTNNPFATIQQDLADVVMVAPSADGGLTAAIERGGGELQLLINSTNMLRAQSAERYMKMIIQEVLRDDFKGGKASQEREQGHAGITFNVRLLYNPSMESAIFMVPGVMCMIVCILSVILTSMSISREKELNTMEMLISAPVKSWEIILGKSIPYFILGLLNIPLIMLTAMILFGVPFRGSVMAITSSSIAFIATTVSVGILISTFAKNQQQGMIGGFLFVFPAIMLSGVMFPLDNMPVPLKIVAAFNPLSYYVTLLRNIMLKGGNTNLILSHLGALSLIAFVMIGVSVWRFKNKIVLQR
ncbi:MAG: ABC transporter permease [Oligoflexia bacterium]|nr:ABC transporter permease [Oligoflexia bacterium]